MKSTPKYFLMFFITIIPFLVSRVNGDQTVHAISWEHHPEVAGVFFTLKNHSILVRIENKSNTRKMLAGQEKGELIKLFYIDEGGTLIPIGERPLYNDQRDYKDEGALWTEIPASGEYSLFDLSSEELTQIKAHPVTCHSVAYDPATKQLYYIESSPKMLTKGP